MDDNFNRPVRKPTTPALTQQIVQSKHSEHATEMVGHNKPMIRKSRMFKAAALVIVLLAIGAFMFMRGIGSSSKEFSRVDKNKYQVVFLTGNQTYFGKIRELNKQYIRIENIYYLGVNVQNTGNSASKPAEDTNKDISLVKLGCEIHRPTDQMVINREQVLFWENIQDNGPVSTAIKKAGNPQGQVCK